MKITLKYYKKITPNFIDIFVILIYYKYVNLPVVSGFAGYLILGYYLNKYRISNKTKITTILIGMISLAILILGTLFIVVILEKLIPSFHII